MMQVSRVDNSFPASPLRPHHLLLLLVPLHCFCQQLSAVLAATLVLAAAAAWQLWFRPKVYLLDFIAKRPDDR
jgi:hypothetical protein